MPKKIVSAFAEERYPVYVIYEPTKTPEVAFEVDVRVLNRWKKAIDDFDKAQEEIKAAQKKSWDLRYKVKDE